VIKYAGCPLIWASKMQKEISLSSTESEYVNNNIPVVGCKAFKDNNGALEMATFHKMRPQTKHITIKYHNFREAVKEGSIKLEKIDTMQT
jgi:hypothetical protein